MSEGRVRNRIHTHTAAGEEALKVSIILPTYNERGNILDLIEAIESNLKPEEMDYEIVVVDDSSPDGTGQLVQERFQGDGRVRAFIRKEKGLATAIKHGILNSSGDVLVVMDTDFNHDPKMIPQMVKFLEYYDLVIGSRFVMGGGMEDLARYRLSFVYNFFLRLLFRTQIQDNLSGFFAIYRERLMELDLEKIFYGYGDYFFRLLVMAWRKDFAMLEVPVFYILRRHGQSKTGFLRVLLQYTLAALKFRLRLIGR